MLDRFKFDLIELDEIMSAKTRHWFVERKVDKGRC